MTDIKTLLLTELETLLPSLEKVDAVKKFPTTNKIIDDVEKIVFKDAAIAIGDHSFTNELYSVGIDKIRHNIQILFLIKSENGMLNSIDNINQIIALFRNYNLGAPTLLLGNINTSNEYTFITDRISYVTLEYSIIELIER